MFFYKQDISNLLEIIEEFYNKDIKKLEDFKIFLNYNNWEYDKFEIIETNMNLNSFINKIENLAKESFSGIVDMNYFNKEHPLYYDYIIGGLLLLDEFRTNTINKVPILECATRVNTKVRPYGDINLIGFNDILGIPILGVITQIEEIKIFQYFVFKDDELKLETPFEGNSKKIDEDGNVYDIDSFIIQGNIINDFYGDNFVIDLKYKIFKEYLEYFKVDADILVIEIINNFERKYFL